MNRSQLIIAFLSITVLVSSQSAIFASLTDNNKSSEDAVEQLKKWLGQDRSERGPMGEQPFASQHLSKSQATVAAELLWNDHVAFVKQERKEEWQNKAIQIGELKMKFDFKVFGEKPKNGRSLFISMHGGGGAPARVNDQQWRNQIGLYKPKEGVYLAPRAPTNTWNLWHQSHIDEFFTRIIENAIVFENVDPNRVYIMGYSAGGDGAYQLAPRMADQLAAAAMMAGHPNNANPLGLRNIGFTLHMGGKDSAYNRNKIAAQWKEKLAELQKGDNEGYQHEVIIHEQHGHWMKRDDAVAVPWMSKFTRDPLPKKVVWFQSGVTHNRFYWLAVDAKNRKAGSHVVAQRGGQAIEIIKADGVDNLFVRLSDAMLDLNKDIAIRMGDKLLYAGKANRNISTIAQTLEERGDIKSVYSAEIRIDVSKPKE